VFNYKLEKNSTKAPHNPRPLELIVSRTATEAMDPLARVGAPRSKFRTSLFCGPRNNQVGVKVTVFGITFSFSTLNLL
jgi:hypothetical protein